MSGYIRQASYLAAILAVLCVCASQVCAASAKVGCKTLYERSFTYGRYRVRVLEWAQHEAAPIGRAKASVSSSTGALSKKPYVLMIERMEPLKQGWVRDVLANGGFEVILAARSTQSGYGRLYIYEWTGSALKPVLLPPPNRYVMMGYRGHDSFFVGKRGITRAFPVYQQGDSDAIPTGGVRSIRYSYRGGKWVIGVSNRKLDEFHAVGVEPFWALDILRDKIVRFNNVGREKVYYFPYRRPKVSGKSHIYELRNAAGDKLKVVITRARCINDMSGRQSDYTATLFLNGGKFKGCAARGG